MRDCKHGQLARSCQVCELEVERDRMKEENTILKKGNVDLHLEISRLKQELKNQSFCDQREISRLKAEVGEAKKIIFDLENGRDVWKVKAEKLAGALESLHVDCVTCEKGRLPCEAKFALAIQRGKLTYIRNIVNCTCTPPKAKRHRRCMPMPLTGGVRVHPKGARL